MNDTNDANERSITPGAADGNTSENDPRDKGPANAEEHDPHAGVSDDPRVDPTPDRRQTT